MVDFLVPRFKARKDLPIDSVVTDDELKAAIAPIIVGGLTNGLLDPADPFTLTALTDTSLRVGAISGAYFESLVPTGSPFKAFAQQDIALNTIPGLTTDGIYIRYVIITDAGIIEFSDVAVTQDDTRITLGIVFLTKSGATVSFINGTAGPLNVFNKPMLSDVSSYDRASHALSVDIEFAPNASLTMRNSAGTLVSESVNWHGVGNIHQRAITANNPMQFRLVHAGLGTLPAPPGITTAIDPTQYWNGTALTTLSNPNAASVQRIFVTIFGTITVQYGEFEYANMADAIASINVAPFTDVFPSGYFIEIARIALRRSTTNLQNTNDAVFALKDGSVSGAGEIITASNLPGSGEGWFAAKVGSDLQFKKVRAGTNITITADSSGITISASGSVGLTVEWVDVLNKPASITSIAALTPAADRLAYFTGASSAALATLTAFARTLIDDGDAATMRLTLGLGTAATANVTTSATDTTANRLLKVSDFGAGALNLSTTTLLTSLDSLDIPTGWYAILGSQPGNPTAQAGVVNILRYSASASRQMFWPVNGAGLEQRAFARQVRTGPVFDPWVEEYNSGTLTVTVYARTLLDDIDAAAARTTLGLGTAATATLTTSTTDPNIGRVMRVGDYGNGGPAISITEASLNDSDRPSGDYFVSAASAGILPVNTNSYIRHTDNASAGFAYQFLFSVNTNRSWARYQAASTWQPWIEYWTSSSLPVTTYAKTLLDDVDAAAARSTLGLGTAATGTVTISTEDSTLGRIGRIGDWGWGQTIISKATADLDVQTRVGSFLAVNGNALTDGATNHWPITNINASVWFNLARFGTDVRFSELACQAFNTAAGQNRWFGRQKHDAAYSSWAEFLTFSTTTNVVNTLPALIFDADVTGGGGIDPITIKARTADNNGFIKFIDDSSNLAGRVGLVGSTTVGLISYNGSTNIYHGVAGAPNLKLNTTTTGITVTGTVTATSDRKYKKNIKKVKDSLARIMSLKVRSFFFELLDRDQIGFIAQEIKNVYPNSVWRQKEEGRKSSLVMTKDEIIADLVAVVQEQELRIRKLEKKIDSSS